MGIAALDGCRRCPLWRAAGRSKRDVAIDSIGVTVGVILVQIICFIGRVTVCASSWRRRKNGDKKEVGKHI